MLAARADLSCVTQVSPAAPLADVSTLPNGQPSQPDMGRNLLADEPDEWEISTQDIELGRRIGIGSFGEVCSPGHGLVLDMSDLCSLQVPAGSTVRARSSSSALTASMAPLEEAWLYLLYLRTPPSNPTHTPGTCISSKVPNGTRSSKHVVCVAACGLAATMPPPHTPMGP